MDSLTVSPKGGEFQLRLLFLITTGKKGGVVKVEIYEVDTKIALYVDTFLLQL